MVKGRMIRTGPFSTSRHRRHSRRHLERQRLRCRDMDDLRNGLAPIKCKRFAGDASHARGLVKYSNQISHFRYIHQQT